MGCCVSGLLEGGLWLIMLICAFLCVVVGLVLLVACMSWFGLWFTVWFSLAHAGVCVLCGCLLFVLFGFGLVLLGLCMVVGFCFSALG